MKGMSKYEKNNINLIIAELENKFKKYNAKFKIEIILDDKENVAKVYTNNAEINTIDGFPRCSKTFEELLNNGYISYYGQYYSDSI